MEKEGRILNPSEVLDMVVAGTISKVDPCGTCDQKPTTCRNDGERALSYDPESKAAQCLRTREIITLGGGLGLDSDIIRKEKR